MNNVDYADSYDPDADFDRFYTIATARRIASRIDGEDTVLELGCATGLMTREVLSAAAPRQWLGLDRSTAFLARARDRHLPSTEFAQADLDDLTLDGEHFDHILATNVLHELAEPVDFLSRCAKLLAPGGQIHLTLQNPHSIHRLCALEMGLIDSLTAISDRGAQWGTRVLLTWQELQELGGRVGLTMLAREGIMVKPLPNDLMSTLPVEVIEGFIAGAVHLPDVCAMNYLVLSSG